MLALLVYFVVGILITTWVDYQQQKHGKGMGLMAIIISIVGWPYFLITAWLFDD